MNRWQWLIVCAAVALLYLALWCYMPAMFVCPPGACGTRQLEEFPLRRQASPSVQP